MSKLGFDIDLRRLEREERIFLSSAMSESQKEFKKNFDTESNTETGVKWKEVVRGVPPPILQLHGRLRVETLDPRNVAISRGKAVLTVDPLEAERNRPYAAYHMEGTTAMIARKFITQSYSLTRKHERLLDIMFSNITK